MQIFRHLIILFSLVLAPAAPLCAATDHWETDPDHSGFYFTVRHIYSGIRGHFQDFQGRVRFDPAAPEKSSFRFEIPVKSISTANPKRDKHLLSPDFFDEKTYPRITFQSSGVHPGEGDLYLVKGILTIKKISREIVLPLDYLGSKAHPAMKGARVAGFRGKLSLNRLEYTVGSGTFAQMGLVGESVAVDIELELLQR
ncbi:YceI family protein [Desulfogranum mediterraneum]|uniref:YceI family protein n=1 Tax=Desulfogranum mediterraneum TaxID=160661 RepID=UPI00041004E0|nr:YceI family protein [Desulfogranum mediterraneum]